MTTEQQRKMLECAAKACGIVVWDWYQEGPYLYGDSNSLWNPLTRPADTAEMCAKLGVNSEWELVSDAVICDVNWDDTCTYPTVTAFFSNYANSRLKAWMHAATMVVAKIGGYVE